MKKDEILTWIDDLIVDAGVDKPCKMNEEDKQIYHKILDIIEDYFKLKKHRGEEWMKAIYIPDWKTWKSLAGYYDFDPYRKRNLSIDKGDNSIDYEYTGSVPEKEE